MEWIISVETYDDITSISIDLDDEEIAAVSRIASAVNHNKGRESQPTITIEAPS